MEYRLKIHRGKAGLEQASADWSAVLTGIASPHFFHFPDWYAAWLHTLEQQADDALFCVVYEDNTPAAILPLKQERRTIGGLRLRTLELPRHDHLHLRDIVVRDASRSTLSAARIAQLLKGSRELRWDVLALWHVLDDSCAMAIHRNGPVSMSQCSPRFGCSHMPLAPWDTFTTRLSKSFRQNLRTANNRAKAVEGLSMEVAATLPELQQALPAFIEVEASGWKAESGTAIKLDPRLSAFYTDLIHRFGAQRRCEIHLLKQHGHPIGGLFFLLTGDTVYLPKVGYDEAHARISPVHLLLENAFKRFGQRPNLTKFNLTSDAGWFDTWKPQRFDVHNIYIFNTTLLGLTAAAASTLADRLRRRPHPAPLNHAA